MKRTGLSALMLLSAVFLSACSSTSELNNDDTVVISEQGDFQRAISAYRHWQQKVEKSQRLAIYSPDHYQVLSASWEKASQIYQEITATPSTAYKSYSLFSSTTYLQQLQLELDHVESALNQLKKLQKVADTILSPAITQMNYLESLDAKQHYRSEYTRLYRLYESLFLLVENGDLNDAREDQDEFLSRSNSLEVKTIKRIYIAPLEAMMIELRRQDVRDNAPASYAQIERSIEAGKALVDRTPRDFDAIQQATRVIRFELAHAQHISLEVQRLRDLSKDNYEAYILEFENKLLRISKALKDEDWRDQPIQEQARLLKDNAEQVKRAVVNNTSDEALLAGKEKYIRELNALVMQQQRQISQLKGKLAEQSESAPPISPPPMETKMAAETESQVVLPQSSEAPVQVQ
ncbi:hypothetical protein KCN56_01325 [Photobacterium galatheae]|uniref:hypothetical protein n=1 Tax=Photobacterium galatheae TaxID=1654360 RepID=UPI00202CEBB7|nr:hypothetical protein [Photobacterium galatheae]MCM0147209.1 hypothetical protein [Photobacterium galatheae]